MSRFVKTTTEKIYLDQDKKEWIEVKDELPFEDMEVFFSVENANEKEMIKLIMPILSKAVVNWELYDDEEKLVPFDATLVPKLNLETIQILIERCIPKYTPTKKA